MTTPMYVPARRWDWAGCAPVRRRRNLRLPWRRIGIKPSGADRRRRWSGSSRHEWLSLFVDPFNTGDFRCAIPSQGKKRPSEPTIDIEQAARLSVMPFDPAVASRRELECRHAGYAPLASVAMPAEDQI